MIVIFLLTAAFAFNCESAFARTTPPGGKTSDKPRIKLHGSQYLPLVSVCLQNGIEWEWDPVGKVVILKKKGIEARLRVGSYKMYVDGAIKNLEKPILLSGGALVVPISFAEKTIYKIFEEKPAVKVTQKRPVQIKGRKYAIDTVVIDPGHGGKDPGAVGVGGLREKDLVLDISKTLKRELEEAGVKVMLTRDRDVFIPLGKRTQIANDAKADFFISIHANAARSRYGKGFEVYYLSEATDDNARALAVSENASLKYEDFRYSSRSKEVNATVWDLELTENRRESRELALAICESTSDRLAVKNRGVKSALFYVLKGAHVPAILVEVGFISNSKDAASLESSYYRKKLAEALGSGILAYKKMYEESNGFTE